jgi:biopolymer transport protein ExbD
LLVDGQALDAKAAQAWWAEQAKLRRSGQETLGGPVEELATVVIFRADRAASYGAVRRTLAEAQERGFAHFTLVVLRRPAR